MQTRARKSSARRALLDERFRFARTVVADRRRADVDGAAAIAIGERFEKACAAIDAALFDAPFDAAFQRCAIGSPARLTIASHGAAAFAAPPDRAATRRDVVAACA